MRPSALSAGGCASRVGVPSPATSRVRPLTIVGPYRSPAACLPWPAARCGVWSHGMGSVHAVGQRDGTQAWTWSLGAGLEAVGLLAADPLSPSSTTPLLRPVVARAQGAVRLARAQRAAQRVRAQRARLALSGGGSLTADAVGGPVWACHRTIEPEDEFCRGLWVRSFSASAGMPRAVHASEHYTRLNTQPVDYVHHCNAASACSGT